MEESYFPKGLSVGYLKKVAFVWALKKKKKKKFQSRVAGQGTPEYFIRHKIFDITHYFFHRHIK